MIDVSALRRATATLAVLAVLGLGTFGLYHVYAEALVGNDLGHECVTCKVVGSTRALVVSPSTTLQVVTVADSVILPESRLPGRRLAAARGSRAPPLA